MVQWLGFRPFTARRLGSIPGQGTKIPQAAQHGREKKKKRETGIDHRNHLVQPSLIPSPFYSWGTQGSERWSDLFKVIHLVWICLPVWWFPAQNSLHYTTLENKWLTSLTSTLTIFIIKLASEFAILQHSLAIPCFCPISPKGQHVFLEQITFYLSWMPRNIEHSAGYRVRSLKVFIDRKVFHWSVGPREPPLRFPWLFRSDIATGFLDSS